MYKLSLLEHDDGTYSFVGSVPAKLAYVTKAGNMVTDEEVDSQLRWPPNYRTIKTRKFYSADSAWNEAARLGFVKKEIV